MPLNTAQLRQLQREAQNQTPDARISGTLSIHYGADGQPGRDGFSPTITVYKEDKETYILQITDVNGTYYTPNLITYVEGSADIRPLIAGKLDADLSSYAEVDPVTLSSGQRESSYLYVRRDDKNEGNKMPLSVVALKPEVDEQVKRKLQTVQSREAASWQVGDYIFLEMPREDS